MMIKLIDDNEVKLSIMRNMEFAFSISDQKKHTDEIYRKICKYAYFLVSVTENNEVCGFCAFYANNFEEYETYISLIAVNPTFQKKGIGNSLIKNVVGISSQLKMRSIRLEVEKSNCKAISFYKRNGFKITCENDDTFYMTREISYSSKTYD